jgi:hypothetical protein
VELPQVSLAPFFRVASVLFAVTAIGAAGFTAWQTIPGKQKMDKPTHVAASDHHPPLRDSLQSLPSQKIATESADAESQFVALATGPEDEIAGPAVGEIALAPDIDAQGWYGSMGALQPEEDQVAALSLPPRARTRPDIPRPPVISGIPILPEPPAGVVPAQPAWLANAVELRRHGEGPMIAIVIDDAGVVQPRTKHASELPAPITIAFIPYSDNLEKQTRYARSRGHELLSGSTIIWAASLWPVATSSGRCLRKSTRAASCSWIPGPTTGRWAPGWRGTWECRMRPGMFSSIMTWTPKR